MRVLIPQLLWIGNALDARNVPAILEAGITAVVDLAYEELPAVLPRGLVYCRLPLIDGGGNDEQLLRLVVNVVCQLVAYRVPTLVACSAGMSRSPAVVAVSLAQVGNRSPDECLSQITTAVPHDVSASLWRSLLTACE